MPLCQPCEVSETATTSPASRATAICTAAIPVFAAQGFRGTSMADLAAAAGVSRPALYQYFGNRADLFRAAFGALLDHGTDRALAALMEPTPLIDQLDGFLQRLSGDAYEQLAATSHGDELMEAKHEFAADVAANAIARAHAGLHSHLMERGFDHQQVGAVVELVTLSPIGLKSDHPSAAVYRERLSSLAHAAAGLLNHT